MEAAYNDFDAQQDSAMQDEARALFPKRQKEFAKAYWSILERLSEHRVSPK
jgi:hypothetical protein